MARTGRRMMPTFPSPPLKFRTVSFPQYGYKASMSDRAFLDSVMVKPAPGIPNQSPSLLPSFARLHLNGRLGSESKSVQVSTCRYTRGSPLYPRGAWLRCELCCLAPLWLTTTPSVSPASTSRFRFYPYTQRLRCAGAPGRPTGPSLLSPPSFPHMPSTIPRWPAVPSRFYSHSGSKLPRFVSESPTTDAISASNVRWVVYNGAASFASCYGLRVCLALLTGYDTFEVTCTSNAPSEVHCHSRFWHRPSPDSAGSQARWANGKSPTIGTFTRQVTAASEAAPQNAQVSFGLRPEGADRPGLNLRQ